MKRLFLIFWTGMVVSAGNPMCAAGEELAWAVGSNANSQLGLGLHSLQNAIPIATDVEQVAGGRFHSLFVKADGTLWATGRNNEGQLGDNSTTNRTLPVQVYTNVSQAAAGNEFSLFVLEDGTLMGMGNNDMGQLGDGIVGGTTVPTSLTSDVAIIATGSSSIRPYSLYVKTDGTLWAMGDNSRGQLGDGTTTNRSTPVQIASDVTQIAAGDSHSLFVKADGTLWAMGYNGFGQLGVDAPPFEQPTPVLVAANVAQVAAGGFHSLFVKTDGTLWSMGLNGFGQLGDGTDLIERITPIQVASDVARVAAGSDHSLFVKTDGTVWAMGSNGSGRLGNGNQQNQVAPVQVGTNIARIAGGGGHSLFVDAGGSLRALGSNDDGQLGDGSSNFRAVPALVTDGVTQIDAGYIHNLLLKSDGSLWAFGSNTFGRLGDGSTANRSTPVLIDTSVAQMSAGGDHSLFVKTDGSLWAAGFNNFGQLGNGTTSPSSVPIQTATEVASVEAGYRFSLFIKTDGALWASGRNNFGQLGDGTTTDRTTPVQIDSDVAQAAAGELHSLYLKTDGTLWAMGRNDSGQLGDTSTTDRHTPVQIDTDVTGIAAGQQHSLYLKSDGTLWAMGDNNYGQLGDGTHTDRSTPVQIASDVAQASAGVYHSLFVKANGSVWAVGRNSNGQLGDGTTTERTIPVQIISVGLAVSAGFEHSLFLQATASDTPPEITLQPESHDRATAGGSATLSVAVSNMGLLDFQWRRNGIAIPGARSSQLLIPAIPDDYIGARFDVVVTNSGDSVVSSAATIFASYASTPTGSSVSSRISTMDEGNNLVDGAPTAALTFGNILTPGTTTMTAQDPVAPLPSTFFLSGGNLPLEIATTATFDGTITISFDYSNVSLESPPDSLKLLHYADSAWVDITTNNDTVNRIITGETTTLSPFALAEPVAVILGDLDQDFDGTPRVVSATTLPSGLDVALTYDGSATAPTNPGAYAVVGTIIGSSYSGSAADTLNVTGLPLFTQHPGSQSVAEGQSITLSAGIASLPASTYQWYKDGVAIDGATGASLDLNLVNPNATGSYTVIATNSLGSTVSNAAQITVNFARLAALAVRSLAGADDNTLIAGLVLAGGENKRLIFRGVESTVRLADVPGTINDPQLRVYSGSILVDENEDWAGDVNLAAAFPTVGLASLDPDSRDAALMPEVEPGVYTVHVTGPAGDTGVALMEVYDADLGRFGSKLTALAVRSFSGPGADVLIVGLVVDGNVPRQVVVRAVGPSLGDIVPTRMTDPELRLYSGNNLIGSNDDWGGDPDLATTFATVGLTVLPNDSKDSAMLLTLDPGVYTIHAGGVAGSGVVLMEVYAVP